MKIGTTLSYSGGFKESVDRVVELERVGLDMVWVAEAYTFDAISQVGYLAARTERLQIGTGIVNAYSRTPALMAMTAAGCDYVSDGRFVLGLGASGPQVIEGFHGVPYEKPMTRIKEYMDICRMTWRREPLVYEGETVQVPLPAGQGTGLGKPLKLINHPVRADIPIWWASLMGRSVEATAEHADGWLPILFIPERHHEVWGDQLAAGLARRSADRGRLEISTGGMVAIGEDLVGDARTRILDTARPAVALYVGGMGAPAKNFYNTVARRYGYEKEAAEIQDLYLEGRRDDAAAVVPAEWLELSNLVGPAGYVKERVAAFKDAGVTVLSVNPVGPDPVRTVEQLRDLVRGVTVAAPAADGTVEPGWEPVREAFQRNLDSGWEVGASVCVYHKGTTVVDIWGGAFAESDARPYTSDALQLVFSTTKGLAAMAVALCVQRGLLDYDVPVADLWPEFAAAGKGRVTVAQLLSHQAGLPVVDEPVTIEQALDWDHMVARLSGQAPVWDPGSAHGYHALTFGWLAGELVRRVDPKGRSLGGFVADEVAGPVGAEAWIGLPEEQEPRVSPLVAAPPPSDPGVADLLREVLGPDTLAGRALTLNGAFPLGDGGWNSRVVHAAEIPAANGITNAASLARIYAACVGEVDGVRILDPGTVARAGAVATAEDEADRILVFPTTFGMGFMTSGMFTPMLGPGSFGHAGAGGSLAFAHPEAEIGFGYAMNRLSSTFNGDIRALALVQAVKDVLAG